jgi:Bacterial regulatory helix-turn-helix protein, lysR family
MLTDGLSDLAIFAAVADARGFTRAAAKLGKSQAALIRPGTCPNEPGRPQPAHFRLSDAKPRDATLAVMGVSDKYGQASRSAAHS